MRNHQFKTVKGDIILRKGKKIHVNVPTTQEVSICVGDVVHRHLQNGDYVVLDRQPTLHSASMQAMKIIIGNDKMLKFNLAITKSFNANFDGDEMNIYVPQTIEA